MTRALLLALGSLVASAAGQLLLASGARNSEGTPWLVLMFSPKIIAGIACWTLSTLLWIAALQRERLSLIYALASLNYVLVPLGARVLLGERFGGTRLVGMLLIVFGVALSLAGRSTEGSGP